MNCAESIEIIVAHGLWFSVIEAVVTVDIGDDLPEGEILDLPRREMERGPDPD